MELKNYSNYQNNLGQKVLAIDYGTKVIGLAIFNIGFDPYPLLYGKIITSPKSHDEIIEIIKREEIDTVILGIPYLLDGKSTDMTRRILSYGESLKKKINAINFHFQDETLSSFEAEQRMINSPRFNFKIDKKQIDSLAASIILEDWIKSE
jgi:putative holliday junction resolvase